MAQLVELERGIWIDGLDENVGRQVESLCRVMESNVTDAVLALAMFEQASAASHHSVRLRRGTGERDRALEQRRREVLEAQEPEVDGEWHGDRMTRLYEQARRDVIRAKWEAGEFPRSYAHRLPFLHARTFLTSLAQLGRAISEMARLDTGDAKTTIRGARDRFDAALPHVKPVRDSIEHAEDRMRGLDRDKKTMTLAPISNQMIEAPGGGVLVGDALNNRHFGCTVNDGSYAEVEVADETLEAAREAVQTIFDALPWRSGHRQFERSS
jgi:hypothetical protein